MSDITLDYFNPDTQGILLANQIQTYTVIEKLSDQDRRNSDIDNYRNKPQSTVILFSEFDYTPLYESLEYYSISLTQSQNATHQYTHIITHHKQCNMLFENRFNSYTHVYQRTKTTHWHWPQKCKLTIQYPLRIGRVKFFHFSKNKK